MWHETLQQFKDGQIDILVGTQTITKGYHFPCVTVVGIIWADLNLNFPLYNAREHTLQQLIQVAGRAGRQSKQSTVVLQTMKDYDLFKYVDELKYPAFYADEIVFRALAHYPPFNKFVQIELRSRNAYELDTDTALFLSTINNINDQHQLGITILGPVKPVIYKIKNVETRHIFLKALRYETVHQLLTHALRKKLRVDVFIVPSS